MILDYDFDIYFDHFISALLWHRLMGNGVLSVDINAPHQIRAYAHCRKQQVWTAPFCKSAFSFSTQEVLEQLCRFSLMLLNFDCFCGHGEPCDILPLCCLRTWSRERSNYVCMITHSEHGCFIMQQGITLLLINLSNTTGYNVTLQNDINVSLGKRPDLEKHSSFTHRLKKAVSWLGRKPQSTTKRREEYHLTAKDGDLQSKTMLLNGVPLELGDAGSIPAMDPVLVAVDSPVHLAPTSIAFVVLPMFEAKACSWHMSFWNKYFCWLIYSIGVFCDRNHTTWDKTAKHCCVSRKPHCDYSR